MTKTTKQGLNTNLIGRRARPMAGAEQIWFNKVGWPESIGRIGGFGPFGPGVESAEIIAAWVTEGAVQIAVVADDGTAAEFFLKHVALAPKVEDTSALRDRFAAAYIAGAGTDEIGSFSDLADDAYRAAAAMLARRKS